MAGWFRVFIFHTFIIIHCTIVAERNLCVCNNGPEDNIYAIKDTMGTVSARWETNECLTLYTTTSVSDSLFLTVQKIGYQIGFVLNTEYAQVKNCTSFTTTTAMPITTTTTTKPTTRPSTRSTTTVPKTTTVACPTGYARLVTGCYMFRTSYQHPSTWSGAQSYCHQYNGYLAVITSQTEQNAISHYLRNSFDSHYFHFWIGATDTWDEGNWVWVNPTGPHVSFQGQITNWGLHETHNSLEDCLTLAALDNFKWHDAYCYNHYGFLCESSK